MKKYGVLVIHGFAGSREEIADIKEYLIKKDYVVKSPLLAGHESTHKAFASVSYLDWIKSAEDELLELQENCQHIILIGFSMGGLIAVNLCSKYQIDALILVNTPFYYWNIKQIFVNLSTDFKFFANKYVRVSSDKPARALLQFLLILRKTKYLYAKITCPTQIMQTLDDDTVSSRSAENIYSKIKGQKCIIKYKRGGHSIFEGEMSVNACHDINQFIESLL